jgi:hypothetical protein
VILEPEDHVAHILGERLDAVLGTHGQLEARVELLRGLVNPIRRVHVVRGLQIRGASRLPGADVEEEAIDAVTLGQLYLLLVALYRVAEADHIPAQDQPLPRQDLAGRRLCGHRPG